MPITDKFMKWSDVPGNGNGFLRFGDGGKIVAAALQPKLNPEAPFVILVGDGPRRESSAKILCEQSSPMGVYLKRGVNQWEYFGQFVVKHWSESDTEISIHSKRARRNDIVRVIYLKTYTP